MKIKCIESSSSGNTFIVETSNLKIQIDCGVETEQADLLLITHLHTDHIGKNGLFLKTIQNTPFSCAPELLEQLKAKFGDNILKQYKSLAEYEISTFKLNHDVTCYGYVIHDKGETYCHITDTTIDFEKPPFIYGCDYYGIEANYDEVLLKQSNRPDYLINRTIDRGHLSNTEAFNLVKELSDNKLKAVMHFHLSKQTNSPFEAEMTMQHLEEKHNFKYKRVFGVKGETI